MVTEAIRIGMAKEGTYYGLAVLNDVETVTIPPILSSKLNAGDTFQLYNAVQMAQFCSVSEQKFSYPRFCTCGGQSCLAPGLDWVLEAVEYVVERVTKLVECGLYMDRYKCCGAGMEPNKPGQHDAEGAYTNFGSAPGVTNREHGHMEMDRHLNDNLQTREYVSAHGRQGQADELNAGGLGGGQGCYYSASTWGTQAHCLPELLEEECCGYCNMWLYEYTRISHEEDPMERVPGRCPVLYPSAAMEALEMATWALPGTDYLLENNGAECPYEAQSDTEFSLDLREAALATVSMALGGSRKQYGAFIPGFLGDGVLKGCDGSNAPQLTTNDGNDVGVCPQSALWAMQWQDHLNRARHYAYVKGMPLRQEVRDTTSTNQKSFGFPTLGYGFWRKMIYMSKFNKNTEKFKWWKDMEDAAGVVRLPCGCTMRDYCPGRKETLPFIDGVSMRRLGTLHDLASGLIDNYDHEIYRVSLFRGALIESSGDRQNAQARARATADGVLGVSSGQRKKIDALCHGTSSEMANALIVDTAAGLGVFHTHGRYCPSWMAPFLCEFYERQFCYMYSALPSWDTEKGQYLPESAGAKDQNRGSNAFVSYNEKRTEGGRVNLKASTGEPMVTEEQLTQTEGVSSCPAGSPLRKYVTGLIRRYNRGVAPLLNGDRSELMKKLETNFNYMWDSKDFLKTEYSTSVIRGKNVDLNQYPKLFGGKPCNDEFCRYTPTSQYRPNTFPPGLLDSPDFTVFNGNSPMGKRMYCQLMSDVDTSRDTATFADESDDQDVVQLTFYYSCTRSAVVRAAIVQQWESRGLHFKSPLLDELRSHILRIYSTIDEDSDYHTHFCTAAGEEAGASTPGIHDDGLAELIYNGPHVLKFIYCLVRAQQKTHSPGCQLPDLDSPIFVGVGSGVSTTSGLNDNTEITAPTCATIFMRGNPASENNPWNDMESLPFFGPREPESDQPEGSGEIWGHTASVHLQKQNYPGGQTVTSTNIYFASHDKSKAGRHFEYGEVIDTTAKKNYLYNNVSFKKQMHVQLHNIRMDPPIGISGATATSDAQMLNANGGDNTKTTTGVQRGDDVVENMCSRFLQNLKDTNNWHAGTDWLVGVYSVPISPYRDGNGWSSSHNIGRTMEGQSDEHSISGFMDYTKRTTGAYKANEGLICLSYKVDYADGDTETCVHVTDNTTCESFAKNQQAIESAGVFDVTNTDCICDPTETDECAGGTIALEDYDPTIGCPSQHWTTVFPRDNEGTELPQCCSDCELEAVAIRDAVSCITDWSKCGVSMKSMFADVMCDGVKGGIINAITKAVHSVQQLIKLMPMSAQSVPDQYGSKNDRRPSGAGGGTDQATAVDSYDEHLLKPVITQTIMNKCGGDNSNFNAHLRIITNDLESAEFSAAVGEIGEGIEDELFGMLRCVIAGISDSSVGGIRDSNTKAIMAEVDACGPDCPIHEINWCNICCDQVESYCKKNNHPNAACFQCNGFDTGTCDVPDEVDELQANLFGYCATQKGQKPCISTSIGEVANLVAPEEAEMLHNEEVFHNALDTERRAYFGVADGQEKSVTDYANGNSFFDCVEREPHEIAILLLTGQEPADAVFVGSEGQQNWTRVLDDVKAQATKILAASAGVGGEMTMFPPWKALRSHGIKDQRWRINTNGGIGTVGGKRRPTFETGMFNALVNGGYTADNQDLRDSSNKKGVEVDEGLGYFSRFDTLMRHHEVDNAHTKRDTNPKNLFSNLPMHGMAHVFSSSMFGSLDWESEASNMDIPHACGVDLASTCSCFCNNYASRELKFFDDGGLYHLHAPPIDTVSGDSPIFDELASESESFGPRGPSATDNELASRALLCNSVSHRVLYHRDRVEQTLAMHEHMVELKVVEDLSSTQKKESYKDEIVRMDLVLQLVHRRCNTNMALVHTPLNGGDEQISQSMEELRESLRSTLHYYQPDVDAVMQTDLPTCPSHWTESHNHLKDSNSPLSEMPNEQIVHDKGILETLTSDDFLDELYLYDVPNLARGTNGAQCEDVQLHKQELNGILCGDGYDVGDMSEGYDAFAEGEWTEGNLRPAPSDLCIKHAAMGLCKPLAKFMFEFCCSACRDWWHRTQLVAEYTGLPTMHAATGDLTTVPEFVKRHFLYLSNARTDGRDLTFLVPDGSEQPDINIMVNFFFHDEQFENSRDPAERKNRMKAGNSLYAQALYDDKCNQMGTVDCDGENAYLKYTCAKLCTQDITRSQNPTYNPKVDRESNDGRGDTNPSTSYMDPKLFHNIGGDPEGWNPFDACSKFA
jgi:hypothetical protein